MSGPALERKINTATTIRFPLIINGGTTLAGSGDYTYVAGDIKRSIDAGAQSNVNNTPAFANGMWGLLLDAAEVNGAQIEIVIVDVAGAEIEDQVILIETFGSSSAQRQLEAADFAADLDRHSAIIWPLVSNVDGENLWGVSFYKNTQILDGATMAALNPLLTIYDEDGVDLLTAQALTRVTGKNSFKFSTVADLMTPGRAYYGRVTHDDDSDGWEIPVSVWN